MRTVKENTPFAHCFRMTLPAKPGFEGQTFDVALGVEVLCFKRLPCSIASRHEVQHEG